ncbi:3-hydroxyacyl-CoA dehydrogenase NAD-binding domain-containing protein [Nocardioides jishulii]|uniref:3-hydroxyacyl-CoA dehydrogenase n=1 Tax=Nocardioides jishulii TaxID=2575440 RepID=A0A4U2YI45_9ACTN|nr:3-hydroxyacyl-CoA dehydrogenase NAD-binding domain-containing protein [Nocardioides jishulii]QCX28035.1 3-hydroxyacyl-CoA dehydrogenase [Nocardioides jishulii]TKI60699.1 3-hydroxyacyl-CoA dehydrogenase [Nocardioides jishulii]
MTETAAGTEQLTHDLVLPYLNHAIRMYAEGYASREDIDAAMRFGCGYPVGPLTAVEELGLERARDLLAAQYAATGDELHKPAPLLEQRVQAGATTLAAADEGEAVAEPQLRHEISSVGVVGTGTMAAGIVEVFAKAGFDVVFVGRSQEKLDGVVAGIAKSLDRAIAKGRSTEEAKSEVLGRLTGVTGREALADVDLVVEAIAEDLAVKTELFSDLDRICKQGAILATTTSSLPITTLARTTSRPEWVIGMHFFNPAPVMKLVEVVTTEATSSEVDETTRALCGQLGKVAVSCGDRAGFIVNALLFPYLNDSVKAVESGRADMETVDAAVKEHVNLPLGPFELLDVVGNDVSLAIQKELHAEFKHDGFAPAAMLEQVVAEGRLGRKTKRGFHDYA